MKAAAHVGGSCGPWDIVHDRRTWISVGLGRPCIGAGVDQRKPPIGGQPRHKSHRGQMIDLEQCGLAVAAI